MSPGGDLRPRVAGDSAHRGGAPASERLRGAPGRGSRRGVLLVVAAVYALGIVYLAWPISGDPSSRVVDVVATGAPLGHWAEADRNLAVWVLSWTARAALDPRRELFQADLFHPAPDTLASSENLLGLLPVSGPTFWLSGNPILTHNVTLFAVILLLALLTFLLVRDWTGSASAGFLSGAVLGFAPVVVAWWSNVISASAVHLFPLVLLLAIRAARRPRWWTLLALALAVALQVLAGLYVAYQLLVIVALFAPAVWWEARRAGERAWPALAAIGAGFVVLLPLSLPYLRVRATGVLPDLATAQVIASALGLSAQTVWQRVVDNVGWAMLALALVAVLPIRRGNGHVRIALVGIAVVGGVLCMGPGAPLLPGTSLPGLYEIAMRFVPGFSSMRAPGRFLILPVLSVAVLAGLGAADLLEALRRLPRAARPANALLLLAGVAMVLARHPERPLVAMQMPASPADWQPYLWLREHGEGKTVLELPAMVSPLDLPLLRATGEYLIGSALHDLPLVNGYSGHQPPTAQLLLTLAQRLPDPGAWEQLCAAVDVGWIVVHLDGEQDEASWNAAASALDLERAATFPGPVHIYRPRAACGELQERLLAQLRGAGQTTLRGNPVSELEAADRRGRIALHAAALPPQQHVWLWADVANESGRTWPGFTIEVPGAVGVQSRFRDPETGRIVGPAIVSPLGVDLEPGRSTRVRVAAQVPPPGAYVLEVGLVQDGFGWFADRPGGGAVLRRPVVVPGAIADGTRATDREEPTPGAR